MAEFITRKGKNGRTLYYVRFYDADGKRKQRAAPPGTVPKSPKKRLEAAESFGAAIKTRVRQGRVGVVEPTPEERARATVTVEDLFKRFTEEYRPPKLKDPNRYHMDARSTLGVRVLPFRVGGTGLPIGERAAALVTPLDVERLRDALARDDYSANSIRHTLRWLSRLFTWGKRAGVIDCANPVSGIERPAAVQSIDFLDAGERQRLLQAAQQALGAAEGETALVGHALLATIAVALYSGLRKGELFGLRWRDLSLQPGLLRLTVARSYRLAPKSNKARHLPVNPELAEILREWKSVCPTTDEGLVLPVLTPGKRWAMGRHNDDLGLPALLVQAGCHVPEDGRCWHMLRHTFASHFVMSGGNILSLQKLLGHGTLSMTMIYSHLAPDYMQTEVERMTLKPAKG